MFKRFVVPGSILLMVAGACSNTSSNGGDGSEGLALEDVPEAYAETFCEVMSRCNVFVRAYLPEDQCQDYFINTLKNQGFDDIVDAVDDGRASYDGEQMQACLDAMAVRDCDELNDPDPESCDAAAVGTVARGEDCVTDVECEGDSICQFNGSCPGTCSARLNAGDECSGDDQCKDGLVCSDDTGLCVVPAGDGEECEGGMYPVCDGDTLFCVGADDEEGTAGTCQPVDEVFTGKAGDECNLDEGPLCEEGAACVIVEVTDAGAVYECAELVDAGDDCQFGLPNACKAGYYCAGITLVPLQLTGTCKPYADPGDDCDPATLLQCGLEAKCVDSGSGPRCVAKKNNGVACDSDDECWSERCLDGGCVPESACEE